MERIARATGTLPAAAPAPRPARALRTWLSLAVAVAALALASCADKLTTVDPGAAPEGVASSQTGLTVWREIANRLYLFRRGDPENGIPHVLVDSIPVSTPLPGQLHGVIRDSTAASGYQIYRREPSGGFTQLFDFTAFPTRRWIDRGWEIYHFTDPQIVVPTYTYQARGVVGGTTTIASPVTNEAHDTTTSVPNITYTGETGFNVVGDPVPLDSLFVMRWNRVPNAVAYFIHVYQPSFSLTNQAEQIASGMPAPLFIGKSLDILVAYMPAPDPQPSLLSFRMPTPDARPPEARVLTVRETRYGQEYLVRIAAVDAFGQLIAYTYGSFSVEITGEIMGIPIPSGHFVVYPLGAVKVVPSRAPAPAFAHRTGAGRR